MVEGNSEVFEGVCVEDRDSALWGCSTSRLFVYVPSVGVGCLSFVSSRFVEMDYFSFVCINFNSSFFAPALTCVDHIPVVHMGTAMSELGRRRRRGPPPT